MNIPLLPIEETKTSKPLSKDPFVTSHAQRILSGIGRRENLDRFKLLNTILNDPYIQQRFPKGGIRHTSICGEIWKVVCEMCKEMLSSDEESPDLIELMAIGDVKIPEFAKETINQLFENAHAYHMQLRQEEDDGYDLPSQGSEKARRKIMEYFDNHYGFSENTGLIETLTKNCCIESGGMRALDDIATALLKSTLDQSKPYPHENMPAIKRWIEKARYMIIRTLDSTVKLDNARHQFIQPDNSFDTWMKIIQLRSMGGRLADCITIGAKQEKAIHWTAEQIKKFYADNPPVKNGGAFHRTFYITPVGNPSGTKMSPEQLKEVCETIVELDPRAIIVLDCVYIRTLKKEQAQALMAGIISNSKLLNQIMFVESFSKTHGVCGERVGMYFSTNKQLFEIVQSVNMTLAAGNGRYRSALALALSSTTPQQDETIQKVHQFWADEKKGLWQYLIRSGKFTDLFDENQSHINEKSLSDPCGLYLSLKLKPGIDEVEILQRTGCLGQRAKLANGDYILRLAVGKITQPTYTKYIPSGKYK